MFHSIFIFEFVTLIILLAECGSYDLGMFKNIEETAKEMNLY